MSFHRNVCICGRDAIIHYLKTKAGYSSLFVCIKKKTPSGRTVFFFFLGEIRILYSQTIFIVYESREWRAFHPPSVMNEILICICYSYNIARICVKNMSGL